MSLKVRCPFIVCQYIIGKLSQRHDRISTCYRQPVGGEESKISTVMCHRTPEQRGKDGSWWFRNAVEWNINGYYVAFSLLSYIKINNPYTVPSWQPFSGTDLFTFSLSTHSAVPVRASAQLDNKRGAIFE